MRPSCPAEPRNPLAARPARGVKGRVSPPPPTTAEPLVGMHDVEFYEAVARELRAGAPVLHSVTHTHKVLEPRTLQECLTAIPAAEGPTSVDSTPESSKNATVEEKRGQAIGSLEKELQGLDNEIHGWKVQRLGDELQEKQGKERVQEMERAMERRMLGRRIAEQDRALRRIDNIITSISPQIAKTLEKNESLRIQHQPTEAEGEAKAERAAEASPDATPAKDEKSPCAFEIPEKGTLRVELAKHDQEREDLGAQRLKEIGSFTKASLVERDLHRKYDQRSSCERDHYLQRTLIGYEEENERRELLLQFGIFEVRMGVLKDESEFRMRLEVFEEKRRAELRERQLEVFKVPDPIDEESEEESQNEKSEPHTPVVVHFYSAEVGERLPLPPPEQEEREKGDVVSSAKIPQSTAVAPTIVNSEDVGPEETAKEASTPPPAAESTEKGSTPPPPAAESTEKGSTPPPPATESTEKGSTPPPPATESTEKASTPPPPATESTEKGSTPPPPATESTEKASTPPLPQ